MDASQKDSFPMIKAMALAGVAAIAVGAVGNYLFPTLTVASLSVPVLAVVAGFLLLMGAAYCITLDAERGSLQSLFFAGSPWKLTGENKIKGQFNGMPVQVELVPAQQGKSIENDEPDEDDEEDSAGDSGASLEANEADDETPATIWLRITIPRASPCSLVLSQDRAYIQRDVRDAFSRLTQLDEPVVEGFFAFGHPAEAAKVLLNAVLTSGFEDWRRKIKNASKLDLAGIRFKGKVLEAQFSGELKDGSPSARETLENCLNGLKPFLSI